MDDIVRVNIRWQGPPIARRKIFEKLDPWPRVRPHSGDAQMRAENLIKMFLLGPKIFALTHFAQSEQVAIKMQTRFRVCDANGGVVDAQKKLVGFLLPARITFTRRKINDLKIVLIGIAKIERFNASSGFDRRRQRLWTGRDELHLQCPQFLEGLVHIAHDDRYMLKPKVVAARIGGNRPARRSEILR